jgi:hypothetical protein
MNWKLWGRGIIAGAVSGVVGGLAIMKADPAAGAKEIAAMVAGFALVGALNYLKTHPDPVG